MAKPPDILNGQIPDAVKLMDWFDWLAQGKGIASGTNEEKSIPADYQLYWATDIKQLLFYTKDASAGDNGWIVLAGG